MRLYDLTPDFSALVAVCGEARMRPAVHRDRSVGSNGTGVAAAGRGIWVMPAIQEVQAQKAAVVAVGSPAVDVPGLPPRGSPF